MLPGLDLGMAGEEWEALGPVKADPEKPGERPLETHPQYHLKLLLGRMGVSRGEVQSWDAALPFDGPDARASFTSLLFAPAAYTARWQQAGDLSPGIARRHRGGVRRRRTGGAGDRADDAPRARNARTHRRAGDARPRARDARRGGARALGHFGRRQRRTAVRPDTPGRAAARARRIRCGIRSGAAGCIARASARCGRARHGSAGSIRCGGSISCCAGRGWCRAGTG